MRMVSGKTEEIEYSKIRKMFNAALACKDPISFTVGEPDFTAAVHIVRAGCDAAQEGHTKYSANAGILPLREAISAYLKQQIGLEYDPEREVTVTTGAMSALYQGLKVILDPGDEVIVNEPCWTNYIQQIKMSYGIPVSVACSPERGFEPDPEEIRRAVTPKTKAIIINSPCNPTGAVLSKEVLEQIVEIARCHGLMIMADEIYDRLVMDGLEHTALASLAPDLLTVDFAAAQGWRLILVSSGKLGSVNHTVLSLESALARGMDVLGVAYNYCPDADPAIDRDSAQYITQYMRKKGLRPALSVVPKVDLSQLPDGLADVDFSALLSEFVKQ